MAMSWSMGRITNAQVRPIFAVRDRQLPGTKIRIDLALSAITVQYTKVIHDPEFVRISNSSQHK